MSIDCRFIVFPHNADLGMNAISASPQALAGTGEVVYLRKDDVVRLIRDMANDEDAQMHMFHSLADRLERIE